jgi:hypothetical protein
MDRLRWQVLLIAAFLGLSVLSYTLHYAIFKDEHHIFIYMIGDIAFLPLEVLVVTLVLDRLLKRNEKRSRMERLNTVLGAFFSEVGAQLLSTFSALDPKIDAIRSPLMLKENCSRQDFQRTLEALRTHDFSIHLEVQDLEALRSFLEDKRRLIVSLLENPNLMEHEQFTDSLQAVFHLSEELLLRKDLTTIPASDRNHLSGDATRAYTLLSQVWVAYMQHLQGSYPYFFSLCTRVNPFVPNASPIVQ